MIQFLLSPPRYAVAVSTAVLAVVVALSLREGLQPDVPGQISSPLLLLAVAVAAWYGGIGPGVLCAALSLLSLEFLFLPPLYGVGVDWTDAPRLVVFLGASLLVSTLTAKREEAETALDRSESQLRAARIIQQRLFPSRPPILAGFDIAGASFPATSVGGDYFDYVPLRGGRTGVIVGDVSGHGMGPALLMAETRAYLRALALTHDDIGEILTLTNRILSQHTDEEFLTIFFAALDPVNRRLTYAGAGHEAYVLEPDGTVQRLASTSLPLGVKGDLVVPCAAPVTLVPGQVFLLLTDGVFDTQCPDGNFFGIKRSLEVVQAGRGKPAHEILHCLNDSLKRFARQHAQEDDVTMVIVKVQSDA